MSKKNPYNLVVESVNKGGVGVLPTDTLYGIIGSALDPAAVQKIYRLRKRNVKKPVIVLIGSLSDLKQFGVASTPTIKNALRKLWPGKVSVVLPIKQRAAIKRFRYLHRGTGSIAFRLPKSVRLQSFLKKTGPVVAPSANFEGERPAIDIKEAKKYFSDRISFYIDAGRLASKPSTLITFENDKIIVLRPGAVRIRK